MGRDRPDLDARAIHAMRAFDVAVLQHEYGIYPGPDGEELVDFLRACPIPVVTVLHTVLTEPSMNQRKVLEQVMELSETVVVPTEAAKARLLAANEVTPERVGGDPARRRAQRRPILARTGSSRRCSRGG